MDEVLRHAIVMKEGESLFKRPQNIEISRKTAAVL
jgi:hypothetical protein